MPQPLPTSADTAPPLTGWPPSPAVPDPASRRVCFAPLQESDLDAVTDVEKSAYAHPWSRKHFADSLQAGYPGILLLGECGENDALWPKRDDGRLLLGYLVAMKGVGEVHLLNVTVSPAHQGQGWARCLLDALVWWSREQRAEWLWLEVRSGNARARHVYERFGFQPMGLRKAYYPAGQFQREDAVVMSLPVGAPRQFE